jgi:hypothetical protein
MTTHTQPTPSASVAASPAARLGASHGYRFDGDTVSLNASFSAAPDADAGRAWRLRLVATTGRPAAAAEVLAGHVVTEVALPPLAELTGAVDNFETVSAALTPSGKREYTLTLALLALDADGRVELHDHAVYSAPQGFAQPRFSGPVGCWFETDTELVLDLDHVENPRDSDNRSGTLSVEVWALDAAYAGGLFEGQPVAGAILGGLAGGQSWTPGALHLHAARPANSRAHLVVMLREWNGVAYVTRDHVSFAPASASAPVNVAPAAEVPSTPPPATAVAPVAVEVIAPIPAKTAPARKTTKSKTAAATAPETPAALPAPAPAAKKAAAKATKKSAK